MHCQDHSDCIDIMLDLLCYEVLRRKLSPEMEGILDRHLRSCSSCRQKVRAFLVVLRGGAAGANFG